MLPLLETIKDGNIYKISDLNEPIREKYFNLTEDEKKFKLNNGRTKFYDRLLWARTYLKKAGLVSDPERKHIQITSEGKNVLNLGLTELNLDYLMRYDSFKDFRSRTRDDANNNQNNINEELSPQDLMDLGFDKIQDSLKLDLLEKLKQMNPYLFEKVILDLLEKMGYGEPIETSKSNDGGIDGIINQDELGLERIYIQCKRYSSNNVREPEIRNFIGAMSSDTNKGIFVTTSYFDKKAIDKASLAIQKIKLINGEELASLMIKFNVGVQTSNSYILKEIDSDFFEE